MAQAARRLTGAGSPSGRLEAELLLGHVLGVSRVELLTHPELPVNCEAERQFQRLLARREAAEPVAYLLGEREFYGHVFQCDRRALIPRPETELLVDIGRAAVERWRANGVEPHVVDVGTGCGAIGISVAAECRIQILGTDVSLEALSLARDNALRLGAGLRLVNADLLRGLRGPLHVVLANLPYVPSARVLPADVREYEPHVAIFGGPRGTELIERLLTEAAPLLAAGGEIAVELDEEEQATPIADLARRWYPSAAVQICQDAGGYDRVVHITT
ncbi:MAG: peptide chain release factor N(5)-glutamine methyltransferase [Chloroflexi bacterium]|nr:peptide chain release factor N(5)-glutamine methyltransferase [Chloroflexota bacterium]